MRSGVHAVLASRPEAGYVSARAANLSERARSHVDSMDAVPEDLLHHVLATLDEPAYGGVNAGGLRLGWPASPCPTTRLTSPSPPSEATAPPAFSTPTPASPTSSPTTPTSPTSPSPPQLTAIQCDLPTLIAPPAGAISEPTRPSCPVRARLSATEMLSTFI